MTHDMWKRASPVVLKTLYVLAAGLAHLMTNCSLPNDMLIQGPEYISCLEIICSVKLEDGGCVLIQQSRLAS